MTLNRVAAGDYTCTEYPSRLTAAGEWLVLGSDLSYPCSEGGFVVHGTQRISVDGSSWSALPFTSGTVGTSGTGSDAGRRLPSTAGSCSSANPRGKRPSGSARPP